MKADTQPCRSYPRFHRITVGEILDALKDQPLEVVVQFKAGGFLEAHLFSEWAEVELIPDAFQPKVRTVWE